MQASSISTDAVSAMVFHLSLAISDPPSLGNGDNETADLLSQR
jgi:hypothetical protein